jgi:hypothetical protein
LPDKRDESIITQDKICSKDSLVNLEKEELCSLNNRTKSYCLLSQLYRQELSQNFEDDDRAGLRPNPFKGAVESRV